MAELCLMRYVYDKSRTRVVLYKLNLQVGTLRLSCTTRRVSWAFETCLKLYCNRSHRHAHNSTRYKIVSDNLKQNLYRVYQPLEK